MTVVVIETERLRLRVPGSEDRAVLHGWFGDPAVMVNLAPAMDEAAADAAIARHDGYRGEGLGFWLVERKADGVPVGFCGLKRCNPGSPLEGQLEIGWMFGEPFWGQGYAREAAQASLEWAWRNCAEDRIIAITARVNVASQRLMERIGMHAAPELDYQHHAFAEGDRLRDSVVYVADRPGVIETARLVLRGWRESDDAPFHAMGQDPDVMRYLGPPMSRADAEDARVRMNDLLASHGYCFWAIERKADSAFLGFCGVKPGPAGTPIADEIEIGWRLRSDAWGQGYAREAAEAVIAWTWVHTDAPGIAAITVGGNANSWGLMERLGMTREPDGDFDHPAVPDDSPLKRHITYRIARP